MNGARTAASRIRSRTALQGDSFTPTARATPLRDHSPRGRPLLNHLTELGDPEQPSPVLRANQLGGAARNEVEEKQTAERSRTSVGNRVAVVPLAAPRKDDGLAGFQCVGSEAVRW